MRAFAHQDYLIAGLSCVEYLVMTMRYGSLENPVVETADRIDGYLKVGRILKATYVELEEIELKAMDKLLSWQREKLKASLKSINGHQCTLTTEKAI